MSYTPGPWRLKEGDCCTVEAEADSPEHPYVVAKTWTSPFAPTREIAGDNARLIAAAPSYAEEVGVLLAEWQGGRDMAKVHQAINRLGMVHRHATGSRAGS